MKRTLGEAAVLEARAWLGTPYVHQASEKGRGSDCLGLIRGVWRSIYGKEPENIPDYTPDWSEASGAERLFEAAQKHMRPVPLDAAMPGDVLLFRMRARGVAKHLGLMSQAMPQAKFVHAYSGHVVMESQLTEPWLARVASVFRFVEEKN